VLSPAELSEAAKLTAETDGQWEDDDTWAEISARDVDYVVDAGARLQALPNGADGDMWEPLPCAGCGSEAAFVRGGLPDGSGIVCGSCSEHLGLRTA
jgi:hypothetical protein